MRLRLGQSLIRRLLWTALAVALLLWGAAGGQAGFVAILAGLYLVVHVAAGGRAPWQRNWKDYLIYVAISLVLIAAIAVYALVQVYRGQ